MTDQNDFEAMGMELEDGSVVNYKNELAEIDQKIEEQENFIRYGELLKSLKEKEEYKVIFEELYIEKEAERIKQALINPTLHDKNITDTMHSMMNAIKHLRQFMMYIDADAANAPDTIDELKTYREQFTKAAAESN